MSAEEFAHVVARITRVVTIDNQAPRANLAGVMAVAAANAFNAGAADSRRALLLARGQLSIFGVVREEVASELRRIARERDDERTALIAEHYPLLS
jgi:alanine racemase